MLRAPDAADGRGVARCLPVLEPSKFGVSGVWGFRASGVRALEI